MSKTFCFGVVALPLIMSLFSNPLHAQGTEPPQQPPPAQQQQPAQPGMPTSVPAVGGGVPSTMTVAPAKPVPPKEPYVLDDGGFYFEPIYWLNSAQPRFRGGLQATNIGDLQYLGSAKPGIGVEIGIPAGRSNTIRISGFRIQGYSNSVLPKDAIIFSEQFVAGDFINGNYKLQAIKASWDYLSYSWHKPSTTIHLKTLWEAQYITTSMSADAPFVPSSSDASGNVDTNTATGSKSVVLPTFGLAVGSSFGKYFRWDVRASGFGFPRRSDIADLSATIALRVSRIEVVAGERYFHFKTSPRSDMYVTDTMQGVYGGLRFVWNGVR